MKKEEEKEIIEETAYDTYRLIDRAHRGLLSDRDNDHYSRFNLTKFYESCVDWMDDELRELLHGSSDLDTDEKFLAAYCEAHAIVHKRDFFVDY